MERDLFNERRIQQEKYIYAGSIRVYINAQKNPYKKLTNWQNDRVVINSYFS